MKPWRILACAALISLGAPTVAAQEDAASDQSQSPNYKSAYALAQQLRTKESVLLEVSHAFTNDGIAQLLKNPELAAIEGKYPGSVRYLFAAARPEIERQTVANLPQLWNSIALLLSKEMTSAELVQVTAYYTSPAGLRFKRIILKNYDYSKELAPLEKDINAPPSASTIRSGIEAAVPGALSEMSAADTAAFAAFMKTAGFAKLAKVNTRLLEISAAWGNHKDPAEQARIDQIMAEAMRAFIAQQPKDKR